MPQEVLARRDAGRDREVDFSLTGADHTVNTPGLSGDIETVFPDLKPFQACNISLGRTRDLSTVIKKKSVDYVQYGRVVLHR